MRKSFQLKALSLFAMALFVSALSFAQPVGTKGPIPSPRDSVLSKLAGANVKIWYGSPATKGREVFGHLEPWGKVYRAGANEATTFSTDKDIMVEGKKLPAGTYAFFVIPMEKGDWTVIFNKVAKQWGAFKYDESKDELRVMVKPKKVAHQEKLKYVITKSGFAMIWDTTEVPVMVK
ncbi:MAG TPA: DUF2911 domain-containing protein [Mucilaginibacter sp.]|nr:DUF2911 domain-containing protein [Mucilaginibacter sp.]